MVGIRLNNTIVVDTIKEKETLINRFRGTNIKPQLKQQSEMSQQNKKRTIEIRVNEKDKN